MSNSINNSGNLNINNNNVKINASQISTPSLSWDMITRSSLNDYFKKNDVKLTVQDEDNVGRLEITPNAIKTNLVDFEIMSMIETIIDILVNECNISLQDIIDKSKEREKINKEKYNTLKDAEKVLKKLT